MQDQLRRHLVLLPPAIDEVLRRHGPLASNRRRVTRPVELGGRPLSTGDRLTIDWVSANRDPDVFPEPDRLRLDRHPGASLLYGAGIHVCPGAGLARLELRLLMEELLAATHVIEPIAGQPAVAALAPACGLSSLPVRLVRAVD
jgi:cytochrome P450